MRIFKMGTTPLKCACAKGSVQVILDHHSRIWYNKSDSVNKNWCNLRQLKYPVISGWRVNIISSTIHCEQIFSWFV